MKFVFQIPNPVLHALSPVRITSSSITYCETKTKNTKPIARKRDQSSKRNSTRLTNIKKEA